jgi:hypothetical protein
VKSEFRAAWDDSRRVVSEREIAVLAEDQCDECGSELIVVVLCPVCGRDNRGSSNWRSQLFLWATVAVMLAAGYALVQWSR